MIVIKIDGQGVWRQWGGRRRERVTYDIRCTSATSEFDGKQRLQDDRIHYFPKISHHIQQALARESPVARAITYCTSQSICSVLP